METNANAKARGLVVALPESALDMVPLGIAKVDRNECFTYANQQLLHMTGLPRWQGRQLCDIFSEDDLGQVREVLRDRFEARLASEYEIDLTRSEDGRKVPVSITSFPETNERDEVVGTLALVRDLTVEKAQQRMVKLVEQESNGPRLLDAIADVLQPLIAFDRMSVSRLNKERTHLRTIFDRFVGVEKPRPSHRWWCIHPAVKEMLNSSETSKIDDVAQWYQHPDRISMLNDPVVQKFLQLELHCTMSLPVRHKDAQVATIVLYRMAGHPFSEAEMDIADTLPLAEAVSVALRNDEEENLHFLIELMTQISSAYESVRHVAQTIVEKIAEHYKWDYVSINQKYERTQQWRMVAETTSKCDQPLPPEPDVPHGLHEGVVGHVFRHGESVNLGDIGASQFNAVYVVRTGIDRRSELCVPVGKGVPWVLNIEDAATNAFSPEEQRDIEKIADSLSSLLTRALEFQYRSAVVECANDAIVLTDVEGLIIEANPAACVLLGLPKDELKSQPVTDFFADKEAAEVLVAAGGFLNQKVEVLSRSAASGLRKVKVLMSGAKLTEDVGGQILVACDMSSVERLEQLVLTQELYREVTLQMKTPMSLASAWLRRFAKRQAPDAGDLATKVIQQLHKAELTLDRMMLQEWSVNDEPAREALVSVNDILDNVLAEMPDGERETVMRIGTVADKVCVRANAFELRYCLQTALSYLVRLAAEDDRIDFGAKVQQDRVVFRLSGRAACLEPTGDTGRDCRVGQVRAELSIGHATLARLARRNHGDYEQGLDEGARTATFDFSFPAVITGARHDSTPDRAPQP